MVLDLVTGKNVDWDKGDSAPKGMVLDLQTGESVNWDGGVNSPKHTNKPIDLLADEPLPQVDDPNGYFAPKMSPERREFFRQYAQSEQQKPNGGSVIGDIVVPTAKEFIEPVIPSNETINKTLENINPVSTGETAATLATTTYGMPISGLAGLVSAPFIAAKNLVSSGQVGDVNTDGTLATIGYNSPPIDVGMGDVQNWVAEKLIYQPQSKSGRELMETATYPFAKLHEGAQHAGKVVEDATDSPALGAVTSTAAEALPFVVPGLKHAFKKPITEPRVVTTRGNPFSPLDATRSKFIAEQNIIKEKLLGNPLEELIKKEKELKVEPKEVSMKVLDEAPAIDQVTDQVFDPLAILKDKTKKPYIQEDSKIVSEIDKAIKLFDDEIKDWDSRDYKDNKKIVSVGGTYDDLNSGSVSIGRANENRRNRQINQRIKAIGELEDVKSRIGSGEDVKTILEDLLDSEYAPLAKFAEDTLKIESDKVANTKTAPQQPISDSAGKPLAKEPWEMTRDEFDSNTFYRGVGADEMKSELRPGALFAESEGAAEYYGLRDGGEVKRYVGKPENVERFENAVGPEGADVSEPSFRIHDIENLKEVTGKTHEELIRQALSENKPVPQEVLKDYPDLARKQELAETKQTTEKLLAERKRKEVGQDDLVGGIPLKEMTKRILSGDETVLENIKAGVEQYGQMAMKDIVNNDAMAKVGNDRTKSNTFIKMRSKINAIIGGRVAESPLGNIIKGSNKKSPLGDIIKPEEKLRPIKDIASDIKKLFKDETGAVGYYDLDPKQKAVYDRLAKDVKIVKRNAKRLGQSVEEYLVGMGADPIVADSFAQQFKSAKPILNREDADLPKYAGSVNLEKQNLPKPVKFMETQIAPDKKVQGWDKTGEMRDEILNDYKKSANVLKKAESGNALTAVEIDAVRQINVNAMDALHKLSKEVDPKTFDKKFKEFKSDIFDSVSKASSEAGRALNIHKREISVNRMANAFSKLKRELNEREFKEFKELDMDNPIAVKHFVGRLGNPKLSDYFLEYWYNSILSGPPTHAVNAVSTGLWTAFQIPHRAISAAVDLPYSKFTGKPRERFLNEVIPMLKGYITGIPKGNRRVKQILKTGKITEFDSKWVMEMNTAVGAFERSQHKFLRKASNWITPPTKALRAMDVWFKSIAYDSQVNALARRASNKSGLKKGFERVEFERKFAENLSEADHKDAMKFADYSTFMDEPDPFTRLIISGRNIPVIGPAARFTILPFVNTISNLMKRGIEMTPGVGLVKEAASRGMGRGSHTPDVIAKQIEGAIIAAYIIGKVADGDITGSFPEKKNERDSWYRQGKKPWAVRVGGKKNKKGETVGGTWVEYRRIEPFNSVIAMASTAYEKMVKADSDKTREEIAYEIANEMKNNVIDGSYFQGLQAAMNRHQKAKDSVARFAVSWVPYSSAMRSASKLVEVVQDGKVKVREGEGLMKALSTTIPGMSAKMPAQLDVWGNESVVPGGVLRQWLPWKWSLETDDIVERELAKLDIYPGKPSDQYKVPGKKEYKDIPIDIYKKYQTSLGSRLKSAFELKIKDPSWDKRSDDEKRKSLEGAMRHIREAERQKMKFELMKAVK